MYRKTWPWHKHLTHVERRCLGPKRFTKVGLDTGRLVIGMQMQKIGLPDFSPTPPAKKKPHEFPSPCPGQSISQGPRYGYQLVAKNNFFEFAPIV